MAANLAIDSQLSVGGARITRSSKADSGDGREGVVELSFCNDYAEAFSLHITPVPLSCESWYGCKCETLRGQVELGAESNL